MDWIEAAIAIETDGNTTKKYMKRPKAEVDFKIVSNDVEILFFGFFAFEREIDAKSIVDTAIGTEKE